MADLFDLRRWMMSLAKAVGGFGNEAVKDIANVIVTDLAYVTPADVGTAISNWQVTLDAPAAGIVSAYAPSPRGHMKDGRWIHAVDPVLTARANIPPTLDEARIVIAKKQPGQDVYITNNLPYIDKLNAGSSQQAPAGFVDRAIILGQQSIQQVKLSNTSPTPSALKAKP